MAELIFWISIALVGYTFIGYPLVILVLSKLFPRPTLRSSITPGVSILVAAYNEERFLERKLRNLLELDYPPDQVEILVGSDGSTDRTDEIASRFAGGRLRFFRFPAHRGKVSTLNDLIRHARHVILVFADVRQVFAGDALRQLVSNFADKTVGAVSGDLVLSGAEQGSAARAICWYWAYEKYIRRAESRWYSLGGATGAIYAIRRELYTAPPEHVILDDVYIPLHIVERGYRVLFDPRAKAYDRVVGDMRTEVRRKVRTLSGNWQMIVMLRRLFNPLHCPLALQLFSHKLLRVTAPYFLLSAFAANLFLAGRAEYRDLLILHACFYLLAAGGIDHLLRKVWFFGVPYAFCILNITAVRGLCGYLTNGQKVTWEK